MDKPEPAFTMGQIAWLAGDTPNARWMRRMIHDMAASKHKTNAEVLAEFGELLRLSPLLSKDSV